MKKIGLFLLILSINSVALVDIEKEITEPVAEMKMLDDAMNRGIQEQREHNARRPMIVEEDMNFSPTTMLTFVDKGNEYILEKSVIDIKNTEVKAKLENRMLTVTEVKKIEEVVIEDSVTVGVNSKRTQFFQSTTSETLSLPKDADETTFFSHYENGLLKVSLKKK
ncbi:MAG: Unknown protein [uncultured Sulfurovum sp.]|uniref:SHSP domain-containing protein n=1 Tax=uncultured Sulfurovum sp. TaxID=269237 RepID=A0A6S6TS67_9BACT|nr:MAG: Unknown protein [uncultured Sulfurovum sp.]